MKDAEQNLLTSVLVGESDSCRRHYLKSLCQRSLTYFHSLCCIWWHFSNGDYWDGWGWITGLYTKGVIFVSRRKTSCFYRTRFNWRALICQWRRHGRILDLLQVHPDLCLLLFHLTLGAGPALVSITTTFTIIVLCYERICGQTL